MNTPASGTMPVCETLVGKAIRLGFVLLLALIALYLLIGGFELIRLGGSPYYLISGVAVAATATLLALRRRSARIVYLLFLAATILWALGEVGLSWWELAPRIIAPTVVGIGIFFLVPARTLIDDVKRLGRRAALVAGTGLLVLSSLAGLIVHGAFPRPADPIYRRGIAATAVDAAHTPAPTPGTDWTNFGNDPGGSRFSPLTQINLANVGKLKKAWEFHVGRDRNGAWSPLEVTPLKVGDMLYACTAYNDVIALDATTGRQRWRYRSGIAAKVSRYANCRGVAYHRVATDGPCATRVYTNTADARLIALDARTGTPCARFGRNGQVSLLDGLSKADPGYYFVTSAPTIVDGKIVLGGWVSDGQYFGEPSGVVRAYDTVTGQLSWAFDMGHPDRIGAPPPGETYTPSTPNAWAPFSADEALGLVYVPTGNAIPDHFGGRRRPFDEKYASSVLALDAKTGRVRWSFQTVHHDLWDYDVASQPALADIIVAGKTRAALVQTTKRGEIFVLDRATGAPIHGVREVPVPQGGIVPGERLAPTQPYSVGMASIAGPLLTERSMWGLTPLDQLWCRLEFKRGRYEGSFTPPGLIRSFYSPMRGGGSNWGGVTIDRDRGLLILNGQHMLSSTRMIPRAIADRMGLKPSAGGVKDTGVGGRVPQANTPYAAETGELLSPLQVPCTPPPFGTMSAIDLATGKLVWTRSFGTARRSGPFGIRSRLPIAMGVPNWGGPISTRAGLTFIGASEDGYMRAFSSATGKELWRADLPFPGAATPMTYLGADGRQYLVVAASSSMNMAITGGDSIVAFALP